MASRKDPSEEALLDWYTDLRPLIVDIVGNFAGRELFLIHGEALMRQCLVEARVDFDSRGIPIVARYPSRGEIPRQSEESGLKEVDQEQTVRLRHLIWKVGVLPDLHINAPACETKQLAEISQAVPGEILGLSIEISDLSAREKFAVVFCRVYLERFLKEDDISGADLELVEALLLHMATLRVCPLQNRNTHPERFSKHVVSSHDTAFIQLFCTVSQDLAEHGYAVRGQAEWDLFDLFDGHVFFYVLYAIRDGSEIPMPVVDRGKTLAAMVFRKKSMNSHRLFTSLKASESNLPLVPLRTVPTVLPFNHPILQEILEDVWVQEVPEDVDPVAEAVFQDLRHWHTYKPVNTSARTTLDKVPVWLEGLRRKRHQRQMADVTLYAASLSNSIGKVFSLETIVVGAVAKQKSTLRDKY
ncbi:hypothetical protein FAVG1_13092 [Fusarium avenaceum]|nr:hypothetical protein FAVG1_13092 [Fusarium avenaceum]